MPVKSSLAVHPKNPLYFLNAAGKAVYLGGHQIFNDIQDYAWQGTQKTPVLLDWSRHLEFMTERNLNYLRNWITFSTASGPGSIVTPMPYARTGPGNARDGKPKFDLTQFDDAYFKRLYDRIHLAGKKDIVVSVMLFDVYSFNGERNYKQLWERNVFNGENNINDIHADTNGDSIGMEFFLEPTPRIQQLQRAYVRKVVDSVNDLDNLIFEIANECSATQWQYDLIDFIHDYEARYKKKQHLVLMSPGGPDVLGKWSPHKEEDITRSKADVIAVMDSWHDYRNDPPVNDLKRPAILDMDHVNPTASDTSLLPWKAFTRGYHYDIYDHPFEDRLAESVSWERARKNVGATVRYSGKFADLAAVHPRPKLSSTSYCLAQEGRDYVVVQPLSQQEFTIDLKPGHYQYEWFQIQTATVEKSGTTKAKGKERFTAPFNGPAVLYLSATRR